MADRDDAVDELGEALVGFHEQLIAAASGETPSADAGASESTLDERLRAGEECLKLIERVRRRHGESMRSWLLEVSTEDSSLASGGAAAGATIGRFEIVREIARGGHGVVFLARDPIVGRELALKVPRLEALFAPELRARFLREARAAGKLTHPNIVPVFEVQEVGPVCYIASEYCPGPTLREWLTERSAPVSPRLAARLVGELAAAVDYAHGQGVLHRDLKPSNVLLVGPLAPSTPTEASGTVAGQPDAFGFLPKLTDFGLAKLSESGDTFSRTGAVMGTPAYMAPEQAEGHLSAIGPATDVYALGAMLYELLVGRPPFEGTCDADTLRRVVAEEPQALRQLRRDVPRDLEAIALKCLERRPERRYTGAADLADDLRRFLAGEATLARPPGPVGRVLKWSRRHPTAATLLGTTAFVVAIAFAGALWHVGQLQQALDAARAAETETQKREHELREHIYLGDMKLAHQAWQRCDSQQAVEILSRHLAKPGGSDLRGFLWHHLWGLCHGSPRTLRGHEGHAYHVAFSPDGTQIASGGQDHIVRLWGLQSGRLCATFEGHAGDVNCLAFSPDGALLASAGDEGQVKFWNVTNASAAGDLPRATAAIATMTFTPDGHALVSGGNDHLITIWDVQSRSIRSVLKGHTDKVTSVAVSTDGKTLASASTDETARIWDLESGEVVATLRGHHQSIRSIALSHDARLAVTAGVDESVRLWSVPGGEELARLQGHRQRVSRARFSFDDKLLVSAGEDQTIRFWDVERRTVVASYHAGQGRIWSLACSPRENLCVTAGADGTIKLFSLADSIEYKVPTWVPQGGTGHAVPCLRGNFAALVDVDGQALSVDLEHQTSQIVASGPSTQGAALCLAPNGTTLAAWRNDDAIQVWSISNKPIGGVLRGHTTALRCMEFDHDGTHLATAACAPDTAIRVWDVPAARLRRTLSGDGADFACLAFSPDDRLLATGSLDSVVRIWDLSNEAPAIVLRGHGTWVRAVAFSANGNLLASASDDATVRLWDVPGRRNLGLVLRHPDRVGAIAFCPDDPILATGCDDGVVRLWSIANGELLAELHAHKGALTWLGFARDGHWLASAANERKHPLLLWPAPRGD